MPKGIEIKGFYFKKFKRNRPFLVLKYG